MPQLTDKQALQQWQEYIDNIRRTTSALTGESEAQRKKRIASLEKNPVEWCRYYFPNYAYAPFAPFQEQAIKRITSHSEWYEVRSWSRELAKSTITMMEVLYLILTGRKKYVLLISNSYDNACRLLQPYMGNLEANQRIIADYGEQALPGYWTQGEFTTRKGAAFRALGAGQSPRGSRNEDARPDVILFDDIDTDDDVRNSDIIAKRWRWIEDAAISTRSISRGTLIIFCGNIIAKDCCVVRAQEFADHVDIINIRDKDGRSTWPQKNSEDHIDRVLSQKSYLSQQREYYNNPIEQGTVFENITYGKCPPISSLPFIVAYSDPSTSNKDKPAAGSRIQNSTKAVVLLGYSQNKYYVYKAFVDVTTNAKFIDWLYATRTLVAGRTQLYTYIENNTLQDPFYEQVLLPLIFAKAKETGQDVLPISPDDRKKPEKFFRIEGNLEPLNRLGLLIFNENERDDPHMKRLRDQFLSVSANSRTMDGPDAVEGAVHMLKNKVYIAAAGDVIIFDKPINKKRF